MRPDFKNKKEGYKDKAVQGNNTKGMHFKKVWDGWYCGIVVDKVVTWNLKYINYCSPTPISSSDSAISNTGTGGLYLSEDTPQLEKYPSAPTIIVGTATGHTQKIYDYM